MQTKRSFTFQFSARATAQVQQKHLHCTEKPYPAGKSPVLKVFKDGLRLLPAACVALRAGTHNTETVVVVAVVRVVVVPVRNLAVVIVVIPGTTALYAVRTRRRAGLNLFIRT